MIQQKDLDVSDFYRSLSGWTWLWIHQKKPLMLPLLHTSSTLPPTSPLPLWQKLNLHPWGAENPVWSLPLGCADAGGGSGRLGTRCSAEAPPPNRMKWGRVCAGARLSACVAFRNVCTYFLICLSKWELLFVWRAGDNKAVFDCDTDPSGCWALSFRTKKQLRC